MSKNKDKAGQATDIEGADGAVDARSLDRLYAVILGRKGADPESSYSARLFARGRAKIAQKLGEEAVETVIEAMGDDGEAIVSESADLLYHLIVLWADAGLQPADIWAELERRSGTSGIEEKSKRGG